MKKSLPRISVPKVSLPKPAKVKASIMAHKGISVLVALAIFSSIYGTVKAKDSAAVTRYVLGKVERGSIVTTVSGTGQVEAAEQLDVKAKTSGDVTAIKVKAGDSVSAGQTLVSLDATDAADALRAAEISYQKLTEPADEATLISAKQAVIDAEDAEAKDYDSAWSDLASSYSDLESVTEGMNDLFYTTGGYLNDQSVSSLGSQADSYRLKAGLEFDNANREYEDVVSEYKELSRRSATSTISDMTSATAKTLNDLLQSLKDTAAAVEYVKNAASNQANGRNTSALAATAEADLSSWTSEINGDHTALINDQAAIKNAPSDIAKAEASLAKVEQGPDPLDVESEKLSLSQKQEDYNNAFVSSPFAGLVGKVDVNIGDSVSSGTTVATVISQNDIAVVSLNEVDAAKVKAGDKASLTFDAVPDLTIPGTVSEIDLIGTVTQGVVNYTAKITFDTNDSRVNPGMSVSATITTDTIADVLVVPTSAVKTVGSRSFVSVFNPAIPELPGELTGIVSATAPRPVPVTIGASDDTSTEIVSGLDEGEQIVTRAITTGGSATATTASPSFFGGGAVRAGGATRAGAARGTTRIGG